MDPKPIAPQPASDQPLQLPLAPTQLPQLGTGGLSPFTSANEERTRSSALWLLIPLFITALIGGGVWAWLKSGVPNKRPDPPLPAIPAPAPLSLVPLAVPKVSLWPAVPVLRSPIAPASAGVIPLPKPKASARPTVPRPRSPVPPASPLKKPALRALEPTPALLGPPQLRIRLSLEGGGDPRAITVTVHARSQWGVEALHPDADGKLTVDVPRREGFHVVGEAPGYAFATDWVDLERTPEQEAVLELEKIKRYQLDVARLDTPVPEREPLMVEAGKIWRDIEFSQKQGELHAMGKTCVCIMHPLGEVSAEDLSRAAPPPDQEPMRCFFAMRLGEGYLVRPNPEEGWVVLRLREPGVQGTPLTSKSTR